MVQTLLRNLHAVCWTLRVKSKKYTRITTLWSAAVISFYILYQNQYKKTFKDSFKDTAVLRQHLSQMSYFGGMNELRLDQTTKEWSVNNSNLNRKCKQTVYNASLARKNSWAAVDREKTAYVFSAYLDDTNKTVVIGIKAIGFSSFYCQFWYLSLDKHSIKMEEKLAEITTISEGRSLRYTTVLFKCMLPLSVSVPTQVSIVSKSCDTAMNLLNIQSYRKTNVFKHEFTICLTPLHFNYSHEYEIIEWIELNKMLGADKIIVYNYSSAINVKHVLNYYSKRGLTEVLQWNLPVRVDTWPREDSLVEIHYFGQVAALQDCLYRNKMVSEYIVPLDVDEFIIPHGEKVSKWSEMLRQLGHNLKVYLFRNTFFKTEWNNTETEIQNRSVVEKLKLLTLQKLQHETKLYPPKQRSKYFAKTAGVFKLMVHEVPGVANLAVPVNIGLLHHYRNWRTKDDPSSVKVLDKTIPDKYSDTLIRNVQNVWFDLKNNMNGHEFNE